MIYNFRMWSPSLHYICMTSVNGCIEKCFLPLKLGHSLDKQGRMLGKQQSYLLHVLHIIWTLWLYNKMSQDTANNFEVSLSPKPNENKFEINIHRLRAVSDILLLFYSLIKNSVMLKQTKPIKTFSSACELWLHSGHLAMTVHVTVSESPICHIGHRRLGWGSF